MIETDLESPLLFENSSGEPRKLHAGDEILRLETAPVQWDDAAICEPLEMLFPKWKQHRGIRSTAMVRPIGRAGLPWVTLGSHRDTGPRVWERIADNRARQKHLLRLCPALMRRRLWGRVLWLDRELNFLADAQGEIPDERLWGERQVLRLYLGANGEAEWFQPEDPRHFSLWVDFSWGSSNEVARLLQSSEEELRAHVLELVRQKESDAAFSLQWTLWDWSSEAWQRRSLLTLQTQRDSIETMRDFLGWALACEPELRTIASLSWRIAPLGEVADYYGAPESWREPLKLDWTRDESLYASDGSHHLRLPPFLRSLRQWAGQWFGASLNKELMARHRCLEHGLADATLRVERDGLPTAHEQIEAFAKLRDFLTARVSAEELAELLKLD